MNLFPASRPAVLSQNQRDVLEATAKHYGCEYPGFQDVLTIPSDYANIFRSIPYRLKIDICKAGDAATELRHAQLLHILARTDIDDARKIYLCDALCDRGILADFVYEVDEPRSDTDHELDWVATRIVPWDCCTDVERTDENNYILLDKQLAENFSMGLVSFLDSGEQLQDEAMDEDAFNPWMDRGFDLPLLNKEQQTYLAWHRAHVFKKWRTGLPPKRMYVQGKK